MSAKVRVRPASSSREVSDFLGERSPVATSRMPSASTSSGRISWLPSSTASSTAPNTARNSANVSVPMYMRRRPSRASARSWYSRLASCTAKASATSAAGSGATTCKKRGSVLKPKLGGLTSASTLMRAWPAAITASISPSAPSSSPSICATTRELRTLRSCAALGRSGLRSKRDSPELPSAWPEALQRMRSVTPSCSRSRSSASTADELGVRPRPSAATRVLLARSAASVSRVVRPRFKPAVSADSTRTSNQLSMERDTNW